MRQLAFRAVLVATICAAPAVVFAQGGVLGSIEGNVFDQTGMPLKGVKVAANSPTQIGGQKVTYTNDEGGFRIPALQPGVFEVVATAPKMTSVHQKAIKVGVNAPAEISLVMEVATATEEVKVIEKAPIVSTQAAGVKEVWDESYIDELPLETRTSVEEVVGNAAPGAVYAGERQVRVRGGNAQQNLYLVDGFNLTGLKTIYKSLAAMEVQTAGYGADGAYAGGGLVTMVTKSGSNKYELDVNGFHEDSLFRLFQEEADKVPRDMRSYINPNFSGPIIKDKLWFYVNGEARNELYSRQEDPAGFFPRRPTQQYWNYRGTAKLTYQLNPRNKLQSFTFIDKNYSRNRRPEPFVDDDAQSKRERYGFFTGVTWESLLTDELFFKVQAGFTQTQEDQAPQQCLKDPGHCLTVPAIIQQLPQTINLQNWNRKSLADQKAIEAVATLEYFLTSKLLGEHSVKLQSRFYNKEDSNKETTPGDRILTYNGNTPLREQIFYANNPKLEGLDNARYGYFIATSSANLWVNSLQDSARVTRYLTVSPGVAMITTASSNARSGTVTDGVSFTPHLAVAWDATHDGRTVVRGSFNQYVDPDLGRLARHTLGGRTSRICQWNAATQLYDTSCEWSGGAETVTVGLPCGPTGLDPQGRRCDEKLKTPRTTEWTVGAEREVIEGIGFGLDFVYRDYENQYVVRETNRIWNQSATSLEPTGGYRQLINNQGVQVLDLGTPDDARRTYRGVTVSGKRREGALRMSASYTWAKIMGNTYENSGAGPAATPEVTLYGDIAPRDMYLWGPTPDDSRHTIKTTLAYHWTKWFSTGVLYTYYSGRPYNRWFRNTVTGGYDDLRARVGVNPGTNLNDPADDRDLRLPDIQNLNVQFRADLAPLLKQNFEFYFDVMNILALRTTTTFVDQDGPRFGQPQDRMGSTSVRLGFRYRY